MKAKKQEATMSRSDAGRYLAELIAECLDEGVPLATFTGTGGWGKPDIYHTKRLAAALRAFGVHVEAIVALREGMRPEEGD